MRRVPGEGAVQAADAPAATGEEGEALPDAPGPLMGPDAPVKRSHPNEATHARVACHAEEGAIGSYEGLQERERGPPWASAHTPPLGPPGGPEAPEEAFLTPFPSHAVAPRASPRRGRAHGSVNAWKTLRPLGVGVQGPPRVQRVASGSGHPFSLDLGPTVHAGGLGVQGAGRGRFGLALGHRRHPTVPAMPVRRPTGRQGFDPIPARLPRLQRRVPRPGTGPFGAPPRGPSGRRRPFRPPLGPPRVRPPFTGPGGPTGPGGRGGEGRGGLEGPRRSGQRPGRPRPTGPLGAPGLQARCQRVGRTFPAAPRPSPPWGPGPPGRTLRGPWGPRSVPSGCVSRRRRPPEGRGGGRPPRPRRPSRPTHRQPRTYERVRHGRIQGENGG